AARDRAAGARTGGRVGGAADVEVDRPHGRESELRLGRRARIGEPHMSDKKVSRRQAIGRVGALVAGTAAGSRLASGQTAATPPAQTQAPRLAPRDELVNTPEF